MKNRNSVLADQYALIKNSREVVFRFCEEISAKDYVSEVSGFGRGSIRNLHAHIANTYVYWLSEIGMKKSPEYPSYENIKDLKTAIDNFKRSDAVVNDFISTFENKWDEEITGMVSSINKEITVTALQLFTHVTTHEFHHKGQIMSMGRILGYIPPDADVIKLL